MYAIGRIGIGIALLGAAVVLVAISCRWGTDLDTDGVLILPGVSPAQGLYAAEWAGSPFIAMFLGIAVPILLVTAAMWAFVRARN